MSDEQHLDDEGPLDPSVFDGLFDDLGDDDELETSPEPASEPSTPPEANEAAITGEIAVTAQPSPPDEVEFNEPNGQISFPGESANEQSQPAQTQTAQQGLDANVHDQAADFTQFNEPAINEVAETAEHQALDFPAPEFTDDQFRQVAQNPQPVFEQPYEQPPPPDYQYYDAPQFQQDTFSPAQPNYVEPTASQQASTVAEDQATTYAAEGFAPNNTQFTNPEGRAHTDRGQAKLQPSVTADVDEYQRQQALAQSQQQDYFEPGPTQTYYDQSGQPDYANDQYNPASQVAQSPAHSESRGVAETRQDTTQKRSKKQKAPAPKKQKGKTTLVFSVAFAVVVGSGLGLLAAKGFTDQQDDVIPVASEAADETAAGSNNYGTNGIRFVAGSAQLEGDSEKAVRRLGELLSDDAGATSTVMIRTYSEGTDEGNEALSQEQSKTIADLLASAGAQESQYEVVGLGNPLLSSTDPVDNFLIFSVSLDEPELNRKLREVNTFTIGIDPSTKALRGESTRPLRQVGEALSENPSNTLAIAAYSFRQTTEAENQQLASDAAEAASKFLNDEYGITPSRVITPGSKPYAVGEATGNHIEARWQVSES